MVLAENEETGEIAYKEVARTFVNSTSELTHVTITTEDGQTETIDATPQHPFYVEGKGWVEASALHAGMVVWLADGTKAVITDVVTEGLEEPVAVYNFEVKDFHTYFVGDSGVLVHNVCDGTYGEQGGHHPVAKSAFSGAEGYDADAALTMSNQMLDELGVQHATITGQRHSLYTQYAQTHDSLTWDAVAEIEVQAMVNAGVETSVAQGAVSEAIDQIKGWGVSGPVRIPWSK